MAFEEETQSEKTTENEAKTELKKATGRKGKRSSTATTPEPPGTEIPSKTKRTTTTRTAHVDTQTERQVSLEDSTPASVPAVAQSPESLPDEKLVDEAVKFINEKANETLYKGSVEIGAFVLQRFFNNDIALAISRNPNKSASYTALCKRSDLFVRPEALSVMVRVAAQERFFVEHKVDTKALSYSHKAELVKLRNDEDKLRLAKEAIAESLSVRQLSERLDKIREKPIRGQRLFGTQLEKMMFSPEKLFEDPRREAMFHDHEKRREHLKSLRGKTRKKLLEKVIQAVDKAREWVELYEELKRDLEEIEMEHQKT